MFNLIYRFISILSLALVSSAVSAQLKPIPIGELTDSMRIHPKPALILITTDWCTYCRMQQAQLKKNREFQKAAAYMYFSEFDAENSEAVVFNDTTYRFHSTGASTGSHELAFSLGSVNNRLAFPTWVLLNEHFEVIFKFPGIIRASDLSVLLATVRQQSQPD